MSSVDVVEVMRRSVPEHLVQRGADAADDLRHDEALGTEPAPVLTTTIPAALTGVTATPVGGGSCTVSGTTVTCTGPALASGAARSVTGA